MDAATITAISTAIVAILGAIGSLIVAIRAHGKAVTAQQAANVTAGLAADTKQALEAHKSVHIAGGNQA